MNKPKPEFKLMLAYFSSIQNSPDLSSLIIIKKRLSLGNGSHFTPALPGIWASSCLVSHPLIDEIMILSSSAHRVLQVWPIRLILQLHESAHTSFLKLFKYLCGDGLQENDVKITLWLSHPYRKEISHFTPPQRSKENIFLSWQAVIYRPCLLQTASTFGVCSSRKFWSCRDLVFAVALWAEVSQAEGEGWLLFAVHLQCFERSCWAWPSCDSTEVP